MLKVSHVTKRYKNTEAAKDVSFELADGSVTVLLGPNGAGKSTIMKSIIGLLRYEGDIRVNGLPNKSTEAKRILGYIPEMPALYPNLTVSEHMEFLARAYRLRDYKDRAEALLERYELADKRKKFGDELSKGMQQKLNLCLGLLTEPRVLLLDEPMIGLDPHAIKELKKNMEELRREGCTLLVSTHIIDSVDMLWDRVLVMQNGTIRANLSREELDASGRSLEELFFDVTEGLRAEDHMSANLSRNKAEKKPNDAEAQAEAGPNDAEVQAEAGPNDAEAQAEAAFEKKSGSIKSQPEKVNPQEADTQTGTQAGSMSRKGDAS